MDTVERSMVKVHLQTVQLSSKAPQAVLDMFETWVSNADIRQTVSYQKDQ